MPAVFVVVVVNAPRILHTLVLDELWLTGRLISHTEAGEGGGGEGKESSCKPTQGCPLGARRVSPSGREWRGCKRLN